MKLARPALIIVFLWSVFSCGGGGDGDSHADLALKIQSMVEEQYNGYVADHPGWAGGLALMTATASDQYFAATGFGENVDEYTHFRGASTTKTFTASAILLLQQQGALNIDDLITDISPDTGEPYVPDDPNYDIPYKSQITIRLLLEHRSGVFDVSNDPVPETAQAPYAGEYYIPYIKNIQGEEHTFTFDELVNVVALNQLSYFPPGEAFHYSNTGYSILGKIIERLSGLSWDEFIMSNLVEMNGLAGTTFPYTGGDIYIPAPFATGYVWWEEQSYECTEDNMSPHVAEGNVISTVRDLSVWARNLYTGQGGLTNESVALMTDVSPTGESHEYYGLGCTYTAGLGYGHNGGHIGYMTVMRYDPDHDVSVVLFMSDLNAIDLNSQLLFMYDVGRQSRRILGIPTKDK